MHVCFFTAYEPDQLSKALDQLSSKTQDCDTCPKDIVGEDCLQCVDGTYGIRPGYTVPPLSHAGSDTYVFRCHYDIDIAMKRCPGSVDSQIVPLVNGSRRLQEARLVMCALGYEGQLCGECADDFGMNSDRVCEPCDTANTGGAFLIFFGLIFGIALILAIIGKFWSGFPLKHLLRCSIQPGRIIIT